MRHKILVVDDLPDWRATLRGLLKDLDYEVEVAGSSADAMTLLENGSFDLALLDIRLDETDESNVEGIELARKIKKQYPELKLVMITGYETPETVQEALEPDERGLKLAVNYVTKNNINELVDVVQKALAQ